MSTRAEAAGRIALAVGTAMALVLALMMVTGGTPARADHVDTWPATSAANQASFWQDTFGPNEEDEHDWSCTKIDQSFDEFTVPAPPPGEVWRLVVIKAGSEVNELHWNPVEGDTFSHSITGDVSHVILCSRPEPEDTTTTTEPEETTTTTEPEDTTTTTVPEETTTTVPEETTTTIEDEVLGTDVTTTTIEDEVLGTDVLPFTGVPSDALALAALALIASGALTLGIARRATD